MQIVITLPDNYATLSKVQNGSIESQIILNAVKNGVKLPKNHGRLIDADETKEVMLEEMCGTGYQSKVCHIVNSEFYITTVLEPENIDEQESDENAET